MYECGIFLSERCHVPPSQCHPHVIRLVRSARPYRVTGVAPNCKILSVLFEVMVCMWMSFETTKKREKKIEKFRAGVKGFRLKLDSRHKALELLSSPRWRTSCFRHETLRGEMCCLCAEGVRCLNYATKHVQTSLWLLHSRTVSSCQYCISENDNPRSSPQIQPHSSWCH